MDEVGFQAAKDFLQGGLEKLIQDTSDAYLKEVDDFVDPVVEDRFEKEKVQEWREASVKLVEDVFWRLQAIASESQDLPASIKTAQEHTQEVINQVFGWTSDDHSNSRVFFDWLGGAEGCLWPKVPAHNAKFWDCFENLLRNLGKDARSRLGLRVLANPGTDRAKPPQIEPLVKNAAAGAAVAPTTENSRGEGSNLEIPTTAARSTDKVFIPCDDYRSILFNGIAYTLTRNQAVMVKVLHEAFQRGTLDVGKQKLLDAVGSETSRVQDSFRGSPLWRKLVVSGKRRGTYRLNLSADR